MNTATHPQAKRLVSNASALALQAHAGQMRKDGVTPVISHPKAVADILRRHGAHHEVIAAGYLHDVTEDTAWNGDDIELVCGRTVRLLVDEASEPDKSLPWRERKVHTVQMLHRRSRHAKLLIAADKLDNVRTIGREVTRDGAERAFARLGGGREGQRWYYETIVRTLREDDAHALFDELDQAVRKVFGEHHHPRPTTGQPRRRAA